MQKTLSTVASLGAIILFVGVAASSKATLVILGVYGFLFVYVGIPLGYGVFLKRKARRVFRDRPIPKLVNALPWIFLSLMAAAATFSFLFSSEAEREWSSQELTSFGLPQSMGLTALAVTTVLALVAAFDLRRRTYRECPHCLSRIRREATRCRYCTGEVDRVTERRHRPASAPVKTARWSRAVRTGHQRQRRLG